MYCALNRESSNGLFSSLPTRGGTLFAKMLHFGPSTKAVAQSVSLATGPTRRRRDRERAEGDEHWSECCALAIAKRGKSRHMLCCSPLHGGVRRWASRSSSRGREGSTVPRPQVRSRLSCSRLRRKRLRYLALAEPVDLARSAPMFLYNSVGGGVEE